jgi:hypothetical protein
VIATGGLANTAGIQFFGAILGSDNTHVRGLFVSWDVLAIDKPESVGAGWHVRVRTKALEHASNFIGIGVLPKGAVGALAEFPVFRDIASAVSGLMAVPWQAAQCAWGR